MAGKIFNTTTSQKDNSEMSNISPNLLCLKCSYKAMLFNDDEGDFPSWGHWVMSRDKTKQQNTTKQQKTKAKTNNLTS